MDRAISIDEANIENVKRSELLTLRGLDREYLKPMMCEIVRKNFEIFRLEDSLYDVFKNVEFYSKYTDELLRSIGITKLL